MTQYILTEDVAELLHVSTRTIRQYRVDGNGPRYIKLAHRCLYDPKDVTDWLEQHKVDHTAAGRQRPFQPHTT